MFCWQLHKHPQVSPITDGGDSLNKYVTCRCHLLGASGISNEWNNDGVEETSEEWFENGIHSDPEAKDIEGKLVQQLN